MGIEDTRLLRQLYPGKYKSETLEQNLPDAPQQVPPVVTQTDALSGYITRYFARPTNDKTLIYEINEVQYERFKKNPRFIVAKIKWKIIGQKETTFSSYGARIVGVKDFNMKAISDADLTFGGLIYYIRDYLQYWQGESSILLSVATGSAEQSITFTSPTPSATPAPSPSPVPTPLATPVIRNIASVVGYASPTFAEGTTSAVALVKVNPIEGQFYVGSSVEFSYEVFIPEYEFVSWATVRMQSNIDSTGIETFEEVDTVISTEPTLTLTIPPEGIKIKANFRRS
jgi:hypothetical protein